MIKRIALGLRYDGARYHGWQFQDDVMSIQQTLEEALSRVANQTIAVTCAGRTDAGVHATYQVVHFDTDADRTEHAWIFGSNSNMPSDISVLWAKEVSPDFHARFSARSRTYRYVMLNDPMRPGILRKAVGWHYRPLDINAMQEASNYLLGEHDFSAYRGSGCQAAHAVRTMHHISIRKQNELILFEFKANAFLLHMVRNILGVLVMIGDGFQKSIWAKEVLESRDRKAAGVTIAPCGLYLVSIDYSDEFELPQPSYGPFFLNPCS